MGTPVPIEPDEIDVDKWYCVFVDCFENGGPPFDCDLPYRATTKFCVDGARLKWWIDGDFQCGKYGGPPVELILFSGSSVQRLINIHGPFDDFDDCHDACGEL